MKNHRNTVYQWLCAVPEQGVQALSAHLADSVVWQVSAPFQDMHGPAAVLDGYYGALARALPNYMRRDMIFIGGDTKMGHGYWVAALGHYVGNYEQALANTGIAANGKLVFLRYGEFFRLDRDGRIQHAHIQLDLLDLLHQMGRFPLPHLLGTEIMFPAPATGDGVLPNHPERSESSFQVFEKMLNGIIVFDPHTFASRDQDTTWHPKMLWYGPAGIGSNFTYAGFQRDHRIPFLTAFPDRLGGNHFARFGDGDYACCGGWPSMTMTHQGDYLGIAATGRALTLRVMDFYRCAQGRICENWVMLDYVDLFRQMGHDVLRDVPS